MVVVEKLILALAFSFPENKEIFLNHFILVFIPSLDGSSNVTEVDRANRPVELFSLHEKVRSGGLFFPTYTYELPIMFKNQS